MRKGNQWMLKAKPQKGIVTLTALILLSGMLVTFLLFQGNYLHGYLEQAVQRKDYVTRSLILQQKSLAERGSVCRKLPLNLTEKVKQVNFELVGAEDKLNYSVWCLRAMLLKKAPTKGMNEGDYSTFIVEANLALFRPHFSILKAPLESNAIPQIYWFDKTQSQWTINGTLSGILIAEGDLELFGKGKLSGAVITGGKLKADKNISITYSKSTVSNLMQKYSQWQLAEKSWNDLNPE